MSIELEVGNETFEFPEDGDEQGWGEEVTAWAEAVSDLLGDLGGTSDDITITSFTIAQGVTAASLTAVTGLLFAPATVRSAVITYSIIRTTATVLTGKAEAGEIRVVYDAGASSGSKWLITQESVGNADVSFAVNDTGQFTYSSTTIAGGTYVGTMKFMAKTTPI